jgi:hypothetical protein
MRLIGFPVEKETPKSRFSAHVDLLLTSPK